MSDNIFKETGRRLETLSKELNFDIPVESVMLPSRGVIYGPEHPFHLAEEVEIRCMTSREEDILTSRALMKKGTVIGELLKSCLINKSVDTNTLLVGDVNALLIAIRVSGYGPEYSLKLECGECKTEVDNTFSLATMKIKSLSAEPVAPGMNQFSFTLPMSNMEVQFRLLTGGDDIIMSQEAEKRKKLGLQVDSGITRRMFQSVVSVGGETDRGKLNRMVSNIRAGDALALRRYVDKISPGVDMNQEMTCSQCGGVSTVEVPLGPTFFWPDFGQQN